MKEYIVRRGANLHLFLYTIILSLEFSNNPLRSFSQFDIIIIE